MKRVDDQEESDETATATDQNHTGDAADTESNVEEPDTEISNLTIGFGEIHFRQIACPACVGEAGEFDISAELKLHQPTSGNYLEYLTPVDSCTTNIYNTHVSSQPLTSTQPAYFNDILLSPSGLGQWTNVNLLEYQYIRNSKATKVVKKKRYIVCLFVCLFIEIIDCEQIIST